MKTHQMKEAGKEILLREALVTHMRSTRDRQILASIAGDRRPLEDLLSFFAGFYIYNYQGLRLFSHEDSSVSSEDLSAIEREERRQLELEIRQLLGNSFREDADVMRLVNEFFLEICDDLADKLDDEEAPAELLKMVCDLLDKIPDDYSPNASVDLVNEITGWGDEDRRDLYVKASGLKESALTLRDELLREHETEAVEITVLKRGIVRLLGQLRYLEKPLRRSDLSDQVIQEIVSAVWKRVRRGGCSPEALRLACQLRLAFLDSIDQNIDTPLTFDELERELEARVIDTFAPTLQQNSSLLFEVISELIGVPEDEVRSVLATKHLRDPETITDALSEAVETPAADEATETSEMSADEVEQIERSLRTVEKIEKALNGPVKGMLRARGLRASELEKIDITLFTRDPSSLIGIERQVYDELRKKVRLPSPDELARLLDLREQVQSGALKGVTAASSAEMAAKRIQSEAIRSLRLDMVWHLMTSLMTSVARVVETYIRNKQDMLRIRAVLKSIYEETEMDLQYLREEILIDLLSERIYEMKCVYPEMDAQTVCAWLHARLSNKSFTAARDELESTPSPVFEGIVEAPLNLSELDFDNYAIAYDVMHRFLIRERHKRLKREEMAIEAKAREQEMIRKRRKQLDVLNFIYTKAHTVFRVIGRVGTKGLEWGPNDDMKCRNLLAYYIQSNRGRPVCKECGATPEDGVCPDHGRVSMAQADDFDNLSVFVMRAITDIKTGLIGATAEPLSWDKARSMVQREISALKRQGRLTSKTNVRQLLPGEINNIVGPRIASLIGKFFNESLHYAARGAGLA